MKRLALAALVLLAGCGTRGGVLIEVTESADVGADVDTLRVFVGTRDPAIGGYAGVTTPEDVITLDPRLRERRHTIELVAADGLTSDTPLRIAVVGKAAGTPVGLGQLDVSGIPNNLVLQYPLELQPVGDVGMTDTGCLLLPDGTVVAAVDDQDCDNVTVQQGDCDDTNPAIHPGAFDGCTGASLGVDDDCNGVIDDGDFDHDGANCQTDCDDHDPARAPGKPDDCAHPDQIDNDCDFMVDEGTPEICGDGIDNDCNPATPDMATTEICADGYDNDCDGIIDESPLGVDDFDGDGYGCATDCDDTDPNVHPGAAETCNQKDDDCDGIVDEDANDDGDPAPCLLDCDDHDPNRFPGNPEVCDGWDDDCDPNTVPAPKPCLSDAVTPCTYGFEICDDNPGGGYGACQPTSSTATPLPPAVCTQFHNCATDPNGLGCAGQPTHGCVQYVEDGGQTCAGAIQPLGPPTMSGQLCTWILLGGTSQQGWSVGLTGGNVTVPSATIASCTGSFEVVSTPPGLQPGTFVVILMVGDVFDHAEVFDIAPRNAGACPLPSLVCTNTTGG